MKIISLKPITHDFLIDDADSSLAKDTATEWASTGTYSENDEVKVSFEEGSATEYIAPIKKYRKTATSGEDSNPYPPDDDGTNWLDIGPTNRWGMFDQYISTVSASTVAATSTVPSTFSIKINTSKCDYIGMFNIGAKQISVEYQASGAGSLVDYNTTNFPIRCDRDYDPWSFNRITRSYTDYFFGEWIWKSDILIPLPINFVTYVKITFIENKIGSFASCGMCVAGNSYFIGKTQYGASSGILSFSRKERNEYFGTTYLKKGNFAKKMDLDVMIKNTKYNKVHSILTAADGVPAIFQGNNESTNFEPFLVYGFTKSFNMSLQYQSHSECDLEIEGLI